MCRPRFVGVGWYVCPALVIVCRTLEEEMGAVLSGLSAFAFIVVEGDIKSLEVRFEISVSGPEMHKYRGGIPVCLVVFSENWQVLFWERE